MDWNWRPSSTAVNGVNASEGNSHVCVAGYFTSSTVRHLQSPISQIPARAAAIGPSRACTFLAPAPVTWDLNERKMWGFQFDVQDAGFLPSGWVALSI